MKLLFVGDVIGKPGRRALQNLLPRLVDHHRADYVVVNVENSAGGFGVTPDVLAEIADAADRRLHHRQPRLGQEGGGRAPRPRAAAAAPRTTTPRGTRARGCTWGRRRPASRWRCSTSRGWSS